MIFLLLAGPANTQGPAFPFGAVPQGSASTFSPALNDNYATGLDNGYLANSGNAGQPSPTFIIHLKTQFVGGANNCALLAVSANSAYTQGTPTDNESETWVAGPSVTNSSQDTAAKLWYVLGTTAGTASISIAMSGTPASNQWSALSAVVSEVRNCNTSVGGNGTLNTAATGSAINLTLGSAPASGDMVWAAFFDVSATEGGSLPQDTTLTVGSGFTALSSQKTFGKIAEYDTSTTSTTVPVTYSGTNPIIGVAIVIKQGPAGTAPSGKYIDHYSVEQPASATQAFNFPCGGNLIVGLMGTGSATITSITGSSGTWSTGVNDTTNEVSQIVYATGVTCSSSLTVTPTFSTAPPSPGTEFALASVSNATSTFDKSASASNTQSSAANLTTVSLTPTNTNEMVFSTASISWHTLQGTVTDTNSHTPVMLSSNNSKSDDAESGCTTQTANSTLDEDNGYAFYNNASDTNQITFIYSGTQTTGSCTGDPTGVLGWSSVAAAFN
jgi:hypothetical protein